MKSLIAVGITAMLTSNCGAILEQYNPQANSDTPRTMENCSVSVADILGVPWTPEHGATEKLSEFNKRVRECMNEK